MSENVELSQYRFKVTKPAEDTEKMELDLSSGPKTPISAWQTGAGKKQRLCSFSTVASEGQLPMDTGDLLRSPGSFLEEDYILKFDSSSRLKQIFSELIISQGLIPNRLQNQPISEFFSGGASIFEDEDPLLGEGSEPQKEIPQSELKALSNKSLKLFDSIGAKQLHSSPAQYKTKVEQALVDFGKFLETVNHGTENLQLNSPRPSKGLLSNMGLTGILKIGRALRRALTSEDFPAPTHVTTSPASQLIQPAQVVLQLNLESVVYLQDQKDVNIFCKSPAFFTPKLANYSSEFLRHMKEIKQIRSLSALTIPLCFFSTTLLTAQYQLHNKSKDTYWQTFVCPVLEEINTDLSFSVGLFGLKSHTQQLSVLLATLQLLETLTQLMLLAFSQEGHKPNNSWRDFCSGYFSRSLKQISEYRSQVIRKHMHKVSSP